MRASDMAPSKYLRASDLDGDDLVVTIKSLEQETVGVGAQSDDKWVVYFKGQDKGLVLNKTNIGTIAKLHGEESDDWIGKQVTLYPTEVDFQGKQVEAIRIRSRVPKANGKAAAAKTAATVQGEADESDIPF
jgi:hypothetical protein